MSTIEERTAYEKNPYFTGHIYGNFSPFYVTIAVCTVVLGSIIILNIILGCCSKHRKYWQDRHTGNRWLVSIWSATPHLQPPLDFTELKDASYFERFYPKTHIFREDIEAPEVHVQQQIQIEPPSHQLQQQRPQRPQGRTLHQQRQREEYVELQKRESDI
ncbi:PREDICTED: uncharacterized protein LOC108969423 [Bactrocera latifrons]|uniref:Uncharacterized protein LOC105231335 n=2 Tax=Bactrocera TaxID=47832 RepID=A0A034V9N7_BACDO|nr:uncharacterized protein LOC105231335 [Bactrocera dorsalis]XP_018789668.1 PREDICTED: uncharacterized protein LOC108969423 [Bactrocera latifrons]XP_018789669.1 PREDICTED: uncharacterized protein LOC108969423 [Bactrocera latifrons]XP_039966872.1 uncharacterized protein LOC120778889 [Bactrocera tryoni]XP_050335690.1 uncharacterized protein LOC126762745 [Bactrocera neohumeralis]XP_050335692.1 uncharacterized protein LOC126762745 [Bactrocera neohumeralis]